jgi:hypothetical protein
MIHMEFEKLKPLMPRVALNTTATQEHIGESKGYIQYSALQETTKDNGNMRNCDELPECSQLATTRNRQYRNISGVSNLPATFILNSFLSKLAPLTNYITDSVSSFNSASESDI